MNVSKIIERCAITIGVFLLIGLPAVSYAQVDFDGIFIFGDSLSDSGNIYELTGETSKAPYAVIPNRPYAIGGHHFSNGKTWAERLAQGLNYNNGGKASLHSPGNNGNYAFGGARARSGSGSSSPDSGMQVAMYLDDYGSASANALYVVQFGGNDLRDALVAAQSDGLDAAFFIIQSAVQELVANIQILHAAGARNFLVANAPNLAHAPAIKLMNASGVAGLFTGFYNGWLDGGLQQLEFIPGINIYRLDVGSILDDMVASPGDFGLTNVDSPCLTFYSESDAKCDNPEEHLFWDGIHPTAAGHNVLSAVATAVVTGN